MGKPEINVGIFIIDDESSMLEAISELLKINGFNNFHLFTDPSKLLEALNESVHICIVDYHLKNTLNGLDVVKAVVQKNPYCYFIMVSGQKDPDVLIEFMNSVYGGRFVEKGTTNDLTNIIAYVGEIITHIKSIVSIYTNLQGAHKMMCHMEDVIQS